MMDTVLSVAGGIVVLLFIVLPGPELVIALLMTFIGNRMEKR